MSLRSNKSMVRHRQNLQQLLRPDAAGRFDAGADAVRLAQLEERPDKRSPQERLAAGDGDAAVLPVKHLVAPDGVEDLVHRHFLPVLDEGVVQARVDTFEAGGAFRVIDPVPPLLQRDGAFRADPIAFSAAHAQVFDKADLHIRALIPSGLAHQAQARLQPLKKTTVRMPGPS